MRADGKVNTHVVLILYMGDVEIVIKVPEGVPKEVVEKAVKERVKKIQEIKQFVGVFKVKNLNKLMKEVEEQWHL
ncbi:MAG: hypothetical protein GXN93_01525 [Candidatus Diapherotrites archaeon]|nr:hypothetical protein [Candidatus Diapherotrites archaeon]